MLLFAQKYLVECELRCFFTYGNIWLNVTQMLFVCVLNAQNFLHEKKKIKIKTVLIKSISILLWNKEVKYFRKLQKLGFLKNQQYLFTNYTTITRIAISKKEEFQYPRANLFSDLLANAGDSIREQKNNKGILFIQVINDCPQSRSDTVPRNARWIYDGMTQLIILID